MSSKLIGLVYDGFPKGGSEFDVLLALADITNEDSGRCDPSVAYISWKTRQSERTVQYALKGLTEDGWIKARRGDGSFGTNLYILNRRKMEVAAKLRKDKYDEEQKKRKTKKYPTWDDEFGVVIPEEQVQNLQVREVHPPRKQKPQEVQLETEGVQMDASGGAAGCTQTREPEINQKEPPVGVSLPDKEVKEYSLHFRCRKAYEEYWKSKNTISMPWGKDAAGALDILLTNNPRLTEEEFWVCLRHRFKSDVNHSERPVTAIPRLTDYSGGPLDTFNKPKSKGGNKSDEQNRRIDSGNSVLGDWAARAAAGAKDPATSELPPGSRALLGTSG